MTDRFDRTPEPAPFRERHVRAELERTRMSDDALAKLREANAKASDWFAVCRVCGEKLNGSLETIRAHSHD